MRITVLGAGGATGIRIVNLLVVQGIRPCGAARTAGPCARLKAAGAEPAVIDVTAPADLLERAFTGTDVVVNAAAARNVLHAKAIDRDGVIAAIDAAQRAGVRRWIQVSMAGVDDIGQLPGALREVGLAKRDADAHLARSALTWTVIRPPWLTDTAGTGRVEIGSIGEGTLPRADLAAVVVDTIGQPATHHRTFVVSTGPTPIPTALATLPH
ncbi:NAD(P)H-binding protein [Kitasatospora sp. GP82]|uniref:NAD(P)H-binding protein n=1 Tax=Kitasatospora sp. GP82 TaxID=3035089 RepID=UPI002473E780|nr:NAD(P)H-binding protein [Kitasatospora sp. GP82]MDH6125232.1 uncharacterized protein YbjT (DUF2867 family) [Kitasatospora sp. GP82]